MDNRIEIPRLIQENWASFKREIHRKYSDLSESDLEETRGDLNDIEDLLAEKLGESRDEARSRLTEILIPYQESNATPELHSRDKEKSPMISDGIRGDVQNLKDDLNAQAPLDGVPSGIQSGDSDPHKPIGPKTEQSPKTNV